MWSRVPTPPEAMTGTGTASAMVRVSGMSKPTLVPSRSIEVTSSSPEPVLDHPRRPGRRRSMPVVGAAAMGEDLEARRARRSWHPPRRRCTGCRTSPRPRPRTPAPSRDEDDEVERPFGSPIATRAARASACASSTASASATAARADQGHGGRCARSTCPREPRRPALGSEGASVVGSTRARRPAALPALAPAGPRRRAGTVRHRPGGSGDAPRRLEQRRQPRARRRSSRRSKARQQFTAVQRGERAMRDAARRPSNSHVHRRPGAGTRTPSAVGQQHRLRRRPGGSSTALQRRQRLAQGVRPTARSTPGHSSSTSSSRGWARSGHKASRASSAVTARLGRRVEVVAAVVQVEHSRAGRMRTRFGGFWSSAWGLSIGRSDCGSPVPARVRTHPGGRSCRCKPGLLCGHAAAIESPLMARWCRSRIAIRDWSRWMEKIWLKQYPAGVPVEIDVARTRRWWR